MIQGGDILSTLKRSLHTVNVETSKQERGGYASNLVHQILKNNGFERLGIKVSDIFELQGALRNMPQTSVKKGYLSEVKWKEQSKTFDFVLTKGSEINFVMEVNYYSTSMSKIAEVVDHFKNLRDECRRQNLRFIYVTDGSGWLNLISKLETMYRLEENMTSPDDAPFLMNLGMFKSWIGRLA